MVLKPPFFATSNNSSPLALSQLTAVGEKTGNMEEMFKSIAVYYEEEFDTVVAALSSIIEPLMIVVIGAIIVLSCCHLSFVAVLIICMAT